MFLARAKLFQIPSGGWAVAYYPINRQKAWPYGVQPGDFRYFGDFSPSFGCNLKQSDDLPNKLSFLVPELDSEGIQIGL